MRNPHPLPSHSRIGPKKPVPSGRIVIRPDLGHERLRRVPENLCARLGVSPDQRRERGRERMAETVWGEIQGGSRPPLFSA
jgi:hypothetical protein